MDESLLMVGGVFDDLGGRPSGYVRKLFSSIQAHWGGSSEILNGGAFCDLEEEVNKAAGVPILLWMADVPNDKPKLIPRLRDANPSLALAISKNNRAGKYSSQQLAERIAAAGASFMIEFVDGGEGMVAAVLRGAKGEALSGPTCDIDVLARAVATLLADVGHIDQGE